MLGRLNDAGKTIIMVTHEDDIAEHAKRIIRMRDGLIIDDGPSARMRGPADPGDRPRRRRAGQWQRHRSWQRNLLTLANQRPIRP